MHSALLIACSFDWAKHDPREAVIADGGAGGMGGSNQGGAPPGIWDVQPLAATAGNHDDDDPSFTADGLELYFNTDRSGAYDIWASARASSSVPWGAPVAVAELNSPALENRPVVAPDGLTLWLASRRDGQAATDIYVSTRADRASNWSTPVAVDELNDSDEPAFVDSVSPDLRVMVMNLGGDMYLTERPDVGDPWGEPVAIDELNSVAFEGEAWLSGDGLSLYYASGHNGHRDVVMSTRADTAATWPAFESVRDWNSALDDGDPWLDPGGDYAMFSRGPGPGPRQLYEARR